MVKKKMYPPAVKYRAVQMKLDGRPTREILTELGIKNKSQVETWVKWFQNGETYRFEQPVGKQYTYGKGVAESLNEKEKLQLELKRALLEKAVLKKYQEWERECYRKYS